MPWHAARTCSRSGSSWAAGGSCATRMRTCSGWLATRASALTAPPLLAKMSTGPAPSAARIVGYDRAVGEMPGLSDESLGAHGRANEQQDRLGTGVIAPDVVVQHGARCVQGVGLRLGHDRPLPRVLVFTHADSSR